MGFREDEVCCEMRWEWCLFAFYCTCMSVNCIQRASESFHQICDIALLTIGLLTAIKRYRDLFKLLSCTNSFDMLTLYVGRRDQGFERWAQRQLLVNSYAVC